MHVCSGYFILIKTFICIFQLLNLLFRLVTIPTCKFYSQTCRVGNFLVLPPTNITNPIQSNPIQSNPIQSLSLSLSLTVCFFPVESQNRFFTGWYNYHQNANFPCPCDHPLKGFNDPQRWPTRPPGCHITGGMVESSYGYGLIMIPTLMWHIPFFDIFWE